MLGSFFQCDPDLRLCGSEIYFDPAEPRQIGLISHGHADHIGRHEHFVATAPTASFLRARNGHDLKGTELPFRRPHTLDRFTLELFPAGHILGSAMIRVSDGERSLLYTGDFKLRPSLTAEPAEVPQCDALIMESTYGSPEWRFPPLEELRARLVELVDEIHARGKIPVILAYPLGKSQEAGAILAAAGRRVVYHSSVARYAELYGRYGVDLGAYEVWGPQRNLFATGTTTELDGKVLIAPAHLQRDLRRIARKETIALTGWSLRWPEREGTHHALPLSDHADFDELLDLVGRSGAKTVYVTHGSARFARELQSRGISAQFLRRKPQMRLF